MANAKAKQNPSTTKPRSFFKRLGVILGTLLLIFVTTCAIVACYAAVYVHNVIMPEVEQSSAALLTSNTDLTSNLYYYDSEKDDYVAYQPLYASENRVWADLKDMPDDLIHATIAIEDKRSRDHHGVDWLRTAAAVKYMFTGQQIQGGSTITQQLIKNLTGNDETTVRRKVLEIFEALEFDKTHTKDETIEWYLNVIYLGHGCYGVSTAAQKYFGKTVNELSLAECASLIAITNNPSQYDPYTQPENNKERRNLALDLMCEQGYISKEKRDEAKAEEVKCVFGSKDSETTTGGSDNGYYSWYTDAVIESVISDLGKQYGYDDLLRRLADLLLPGPQGAGQGGRHLRRCQQHSPVQIRRRSGSAQRHHGGGQQDRRCGRTGRRHRRKDGQPHLELRHRLPPSPRLLHQAPGRVRTGHGGGFDPPLLRRGRHPLPAEQ